MEKILSKIFEKYDLKLKLENKVTKGFLSENHILTDEKTKYFLKKYRFENKKRIEEIHAVKKYFFDGKIPVILPLSTKKGDTFFTIDDSNYALFPFVNGKQFERGNIPEIAAHSLAKTLGHIHLLGKKAKLQIEEKFSAWNKNEVLERISLIEEKIKEKTSLSDFDKLALESINLKKDLILSNKINFEDLNLHSDHLIHGDYSDQNVFFDDNDNVSHVFDFEKSEYTPRSFELFRSMTYSFLTDDISSADIAKMRSYINAYLEIYSMSKEEIKNGLILFYLKEVHSVWVEKEHYLKNNCRVDGFLTDGFLRVKYLSKNLDAFLKTLTL